MGLRGGGGSEGEGMGVRGGPEDGWMRVRGGPEGEGVGLRVREWA